MASVEQRNGSTAEGRCRVPEGDQARRAARGPSRRGLREAVRAAYAAGMRKADILRATDHVWSLTWVDEAVRDLERGEG